MSSLIFSSRFSVQNKVVNCQKRPCPVQCSNPVSSDTCCPVCDSCLYEGDIHHHAHTFTPSSKPCQRCTCVRGSVTCVPLVCPQIICARPVTRPGQCCPECTGSLWPYCANEVYGYVTQIAVGRGIKQSKTFIQFNICC